MPLYKSLKTKLKLNNHQRTLLAQHAGSARWTWNWALEICNQALEAKQKLPTAIDLHKRLVAEVKPERPWLCQVSKWTPQNALRHLERAFRDWWRVEGKKQPRFKKKGQHNSFTLDGDISIGGTRHKFPKIGWLDTYEGLPHCKVKSVTISRKANDWYIAFRVEIEPEQTPKQRDRIGVDVGINALATCSDGTKFPNVRAYKKAKRRIKFLQRALCRKQLDSKNRQKARMRLAKAHRRVANIRLDAIHKLTTHLAKNHGTIVIENLNVSGMVKNHRLASAIADSGFYEFRRQLEYKAERYGSKVLIADRFFPSTQLCSQCHHKQKMPLDIRTYKCQSCGFEADRDFNASVNLENYPILAVSSTVTACGDSHQPEATA